MSLLADLLSKVKYKSTSGAEGHRTDVPPGLKQVVSSSTEKVAIKRRMIISSILALLIILSGVVTVYFMKLYIKPSGVKKIAKTTAPEQSERKITPPFLEPEKRPETEPETTETQEKQKPAFRIDSASRQKDSKTMSKKAPQQRHYRKKEVIKKKRTTEKQPPKPTTEDISGDSHERAVTAQGPRMKTQDPQKDVYLYTAMTYESKKDYHQALSNYKKALEIDPDNYIIMNNISSVLIHLGSFEEAIKYSKNALSIRKDYVPSLINTGIAYIRLNNLTEGEGYLLRVLSIEPSNSYALLNLGILYERLGDNDKAYSYYSRLSDIGNIEGYLGIARIFERQGKTPDALRIYKEIISRDNIDPKIKKLANERLLQLQ